MLAIIVATLVPILNSIQLFPQLYKTYITKSVQDLSFYSLLLILATNVLWLIHGYIRRDVSLIFAGVISTFINIILLTLFLQYRNK